MPVRDRSLAAECDVPDVIQIADYDQGAKVFNEAAQHLMGMSGEEFLRRWDAGEFRDEAEHPRAAELAMMISFVRPVPADAR